MCVEPRTQRACGASCALVRTMAAGTIRGKKQPRTRDLNISISGRSLCRYRTDHKRTTLLDIDPARMRDRMGGDRIDG
jgi:hypothetical protein